MAATAAALGLTGRWYVGCSWVPVVIATFIGGIAAIYANMISFEQGEQITPNPKVRKLLEKIGAIDPDFQFEDRVARLKFWIKVSLLTIAVLGTGVERLVVSPACKAPQAEEQQSTEPPKHETETNGQSEGKGEATN